MFGDGDFGLRHAEERGTVPGHVCCVVQKIDQVLDWNRHLLEVNEKHIQCSRSSHFLTFDLNAEP
jgi:hypothetical protein